MSRIVCDYHPVLRPHAKYPIGIALDAMPQRRLARDEVDPSPRVGLADQIRNYLGRFDAADFVRMLSKDDAAALRQALADHGEDMEIGLGENDTGRTVGVMPENAMDEALKYAPGIANIEAGVYGSYAPTDEANGRRRHASADYSEDARALAEKFAPGIEHITVGA